MKPLLLPSLLLLTGLLAPACARRQPADPPPVVVAVPPPPPPAPTPPPARVAAAHDLADIMGTDLGLTPEQTTQVRQILNNAVVEVNTAQRNYAPQSPQRTAELKRISAASETQLREVLGPEKFQQFQQQKRQMQAKMQQRPK